MAHQHYGTQSIGGLNSQVAPHLLGDSDLQTADNCDFTEVGAARDSAGDLLLIDPDDTLTSGGSALLGGVSHYFYKVSGTLRSVTDYNADTDSSVLVGGGAWPGVAWGSGPLRMAQSNDSVVLTDGTLCRFWDGAVLYGFGAPDATLSSVGNYITVNEATSETIASIAVAAGVVTVTLDSAMALDDGDKVWIAGVEGGYTEINGALYEIQNETGTTFELVGVDGTDWGTGAITAGSVYLDACGLEGTYTYRVSNEVTLPGGKTVEGSAVTVQKVYGAEREDEITLAPTDNVRITLSGFTSVDVTSWINGTYVMGSTLKVKRKLYRSKVGDTAQAYLLDELEHDDCYAIAPSAITDQTPDASLGAVWLPVAFDAHDAPPAFSTAVTHAQRLYVAVDNKLYFSGLDGHGYFQPLDYLEMDEDITALASVGDFVAVFAANGAWLYDPFNVAVKNLKLRYGVESQEAVHAFDGRVWYANDLGLYVLDSAQLGGFSVDAVQSTPMTAAIDDEWRAAGPGDWHLGSTHNKLFCVCNKDGDSSTFALATTGEPRWSKVTMTADIAALMSDKRLNRCLYLGSDDSIWIFHGGGSQRTLTIKSKAYVGRRGQASMMLVDVGAGADLIAQVSTNYGQSATISVDGGTYRTRAVLPLPMVTGEIFEVQFSGTGTIYGWTLQVDVLDGQIY